MASVDDFLAKLLFIDGEIRRGPVLERRRCETALRNSLIEAIRLSRISLARAVNGPVYDALMVEGLKAGQVIKSPQRCDCLDVTFSSVLRFHFLNF